MTFLKGALKRGDIFNMQLLELLIKSLSLNIFLSHWKRKGRKPNEYNIS